MVKTKSVAIGGAGLSALAFGGDIAKGAVDGVHYVVSAVGWETMTDNLAGLIAAIVAASVVGLIRFAQSFLPPSQR